MINRKSVFKKKEKNKTNEYVRTLIIRFYFMFVFIVSEGSFIEIIKSIDKLFLKIR